MNCAKILSFLVVLFICTIKSRRFRRICEEQGTCINCSDNRYSYYKCNASHDCFTDENCTEQSFCCPTSEFNRIVLPLSNNDFEFIGVPALKYESEKSGMCPDGTPWHQQCSNDKDCMINDEICVMGKCCTVCSQHRRQVLNDLPTNNVIGVHIPQCDSTGKYYRAVQCRIGTEECWCVSRFGRIIGSLKPKTVNLNAACKALRLTVKRILDEKRDQIEVRRKPENLTTTKQESQSFVILSKGQSSERISDKCLWMKSGQCPEQPIPLTGTSKFCYCDSDCSDSQKCCPVLTGGLACFLNVTVNNDQFSTTAHSSLSNSTTMKEICAENEQFVECIDECQPACFSRKPIPCFIKRCKSGCQCKSGFIRQLSDQHAPCIPENECPQQVTEIERRCIDPLREYRICGPVCPISCTSKKEKCKTEGCVKGCFCKVPYILENGADPIRSRCILPIYCPPLIEDNYPVSATIYFAPMTPMTLNPNLFRGHGEDSITQSTVMQCNDPLKNFQICGSACPVGCNNQIAGFCGIQCIPGCFCRNPYILQDAYNLNSQCILPHQCQSSTIQQHICSDPRKEWTHCFSYECARSCSNPEAKCTSSDCTPGCACREPYLLSDSRNPNSRCVLPSECGSQCSDPLKEYQACASSCPVGCNNPLPQTCSPCVSGCFCKSGFVFEDAINWRTSKCTPFNQCPTTNISALLIAFNPQDNNNSANMTECPATTVDLSGKFCNFDSDCPVQQRCCRSNLFAMISSKRSRCTCIDPHAYWDSCGILCPEYCGQPATPVCSSTCNPGCHCASGYVKARNHVMAPCVLRTQCLQLKKYDDTAQDSKRTTKAYKVWKEIATAKILSDGNKIIGDVKIKEINKERIKLEGAIEGLPNGEHALILHQAGDLSNSCANIGPVMAPDKKFNVSAIFGDIKADGIKNATIDREIDWPQDISLIGHSLAIHKLSVMEWSLRSKDILPLACGTIGFASS
ncbi:Trypsin Inhibitor like cysteine rich domain family protein [Acanthocheilonema viteae]